MATAAERGVVKAGAGVHGIVLVTFPAASTIFTSPKEYGLSSTAYGAMFLPAGAHGDHLRAARGEPVREVGTRRLFLLGRVANLTSMILLLLSALVGSPRSARDRSSTRASSFPRYGLTAFVAAAMGAVAFVVVRRGTEPGALHPRRR